MPEPAPPASPEAAASVQSVTPGHYDYKGLNWVEVGGHVLMPEAALERINLGYATLLLQTQPESHPIAGSARIVVPDHDRFRVLSGAFYRVALNGGVEFYAEFLRLNARSIADDIARAHLFTSVTVVEQNNTVEPSADGADYLIWLEVRSATPNNAGPWSGHWRLKRAGNPAIASLYFDYGTAAGLPRYRSFLEGVRFAAANPAASTDGGPDSVAASGSGIVIDADGHVLTNNHVIDGCKKLRVTDAGGSAAAAKLIAGDAANDLALLKTERHASAWASFRDIQGLRPGDPVVLTGFPLAGVVSPEMAVNTGSLTALSGLHGDSRQLEFSAPVQPGNSGGPLLDNNARVIGITIGTLDKDSTGPSSAGGPQLQNVNFAIRTNSVRGFLDTHDVKVDTAAAGQGLTAAEVGDIARKFTVKVECLR